MEKNVYRYPGAHFIATPVDLLVVSRVKTASPQVPYLALLFDLDAVALGETAKELKFVATDKTKMRSYGIFSGKADDKMLESAVRLVRTLADPDDAQILGPLTIREIYYRLLKSEHGYPIYQLTQAKSKIQKMAQVVQKMRSDLTLDVDVDELAKKTAMSRSTFFKLFRDITSMSPIQYQKRLRLLEARRLLIEKGESAEGAAYSVGYNSSSQFSREYTRMFGNSPLRDAVRNGQIEGSR